MNKIINLAFYAMLSEIGIFAICSSLPTVYNSMYYMLYGSDSYRLNKKMDMIIQQNKLLKLEVNKMKDEKLIRDYELQDLNFDVVLTKDYIDYFNQ